MLPECNSWARRVLRFDPAAGDLERDLAVDVPEDVRDRPSITRNIAETGLAPVRFDASIGQKATVAQVPEEIEAKHELLAGGAIPDRQRVSARAEEEIAGRVERRGRPVVVGGGEHADDLPGLGVDDRGRARREVDREPPVV